jgi:hypothetical protein
MRKLLDLRNEFVKEFKITKDEYDLEAIETSGTTIDFYYEVADKYGKRIRRLKTIPKV